MEQTKLVAFDEVINSPLYCKRIVDSFKPTIETRHSISQKVCDTRRRFNAGSEISDKTMRDYLKRAGYRLIHPEMWQIN